MYYNFNFSGCLIPLLFLLFVIFIFTKLWWLVAIMVIVYILNQYLTMIRQKLEQHKKEQAKFNPEMGEIYKVCPHCNEKVKVTDLTCPHCGNELN